MGENAARVAWAGVGRVAPAAAHHAARRPAGRAEAARRAVLRAAGRRAARMGRAQRRRRSRGRRGRKLENPCRFPLCSLDAWIEAHPHEEEGRHASHGAGQGNRGERSRRDAERGAAERDAGLQRGAGEGRRDARRRRPASQLEGARVVFTGSERKVIDGPFAETKELLAGYWLWQVKSLDEAIEWVKRVPDPMPGSEAISRSARSSRPRTSATSSLPSCAPRSEELRQQVDSRRVGETTRGRRPAHA